MIHAPFMASDISTVIINSNPNKISMSIIVTIFSTIEIKHTPGNTEELDISLGLDTISTHSFQSNIAKTHVNTARRLRFINDAITDTLY